MPMHCVVCGSEPASFEAVSVVGIGDHCFRCYNQDVARRMGVDFDNTALAPVVLNDGEGFPHRFEIRSRLVPTGRVMDALEIQEGQARGYRFSVLGDFEADAMTLFAQLYERMRAGLGRAARPSWRPGLAAHQGRHSERMDRGRPRRRPPHADPGHRREGVLLASVHLGEGHG
jgi:hypothetical protein